MVCFLKQRPLLVQMKRINKLLLVFLIIVVFSCDNGKLINEKTLVKVETFKEQHQVSTPLALGDSWIEYVEPTIIEDSIILRSISDLIEELDRSNNEFDDDVLLLRSILHFDDSSRYILDYDLRSIKIEGIVYKDSIVLRELLAGNTMTE